MRQFRVVIALAVVACSLLAGAGAALACIPSAFGAGSPSGGSVAPGDPVRFTIGVKNTAGGETTSAYTVSVTGAGAVASGQVGPGGTEGTFTMPDLGPGERSVTVRVSTTDPSAENAPMSSTVAYRSAPAQPKGQAPAAEQSPAETAPPAAAPGTSAAPQAAPVRAGRPTVHAGAGNGAPVASHSRPAKSARPAVSRARPRTRGTRHTSVAPQRATVTTAAPAQVRGIAPQAASRKQPTGSARPARAGRHLPAAARPAARALRPTAPVTRRALPEVATAKADRAADKGSEGVVAAVLAALLAGGLLVLRRRPPADPDAALEPAPTTLAPSETDAELTLEAELQELIAEDSAARLETPTEDPHVSVHV